MRHFSDIYRRRMDSNSPSVWSGVAAALGLLLALIPGTVLGQEPEPGMEEESDDEYLVEPRGDQGNDEDDEESASDPNQEQDSPEESPSGESGQQERRESSSGESRQQESRESPSGESGQQERRESPSGESGRQEDDAARDVAGSSGEEASRESRSRERRPSGERRAPSDSGAESSERQEEPVEPEPSVEKEGPDREEAKKRQKALRRQIRSGQNAVPIYQIAEEMIDEVVIDVRDIRTVAVSPTAMRKMGLTPNLSDQFGDFIEATLVNALANDTEIDVKRCEACQSLRSRIEDGDWVVSLGMTRQEQLRNEARRLGVKTFLNARFSYYPGANIAAMNVEFVRADDGKILWSETYRSDATTAAILRSGDRELSRKERVSELERKIEERPYFGYMLYLGNAHIPYDSPDGGITGASLGMRLYEQWGPQKRWRYGIGGEAFANFSSNPLLGAFLGATVQYEILEPNLNRPTVRTGPTISGFLSGFGAGGGGQQANSGAIEWGVDVVMQFRLGAGLSLMYFIPTTFAGADLGGFSYKARISFNW